MSNHEIELLQIAGGIIATCTALVLSLISGRKLVSSLTSFEDMSPIWTVMFLMSASSTVWFAWVLFQHTEWVGILLVVGIVFGKKLNYRAEI